MRLQLPAVKSVCVMCPHVNAPGHPSRAPSATNPALFHASYPVICPIFLVAACFGGGLASISSGLRTRQAHNTPYLLL